MKILFITTRWPVPPITGDRLRAYYMLKELSKHHRVTLISFCKNPREMKKLTSSRMKLNLKPVYVKEGFSYAKAFRGLFSAKPLQLQFYYFSKMNRVIRQEIRSGNYDVIFTNMIRAAQYVSEINYLPKIVDLIDAVSLTYKRMLDYSAGKRNLFFEQVYTLEKKRVLRYELEIIKKFDHALLVSEIDKNYFKPYAPVDNVQVISNGVNTDYFHYSYNDYNPFRITFHGNIHYQPNNDAVSYFYHEIFPRIKMKEPRANFFIVGNQPRRSVLQMTSDPDVYVTGRINDIRPYLLDSAVSICPIRMGAGMQNKILEAMAVGAPVVTSSVGLEGIDAQNGEHVLVADDADSFAEAVLQLMREKSYRRQISEQARHLIEEKYTWEKTLFPLMEMLAGMKTKNFRR